MNIKKYRQIRVLVTFFVAAIVGVATIKNSYLLAAAGVITGMIFMAFARSKTKITVDERERTIREKAAQFTYAIFTPTIGVASLFLILSARDEFYYTESLGYIFAYLALFLITLYAISFRYFDRKLGGGKDDK